MTKQISRSGRISARHRWVLIAALGAALSLILTGTPAARGQTAAAPAASTGTPVTPCPAQIDAGPGGAPTVPPIPRSVVLPPVTLPAGAALYGTTQPTVSSVTFSLAPPGFRCTATLGADGSYFIELTAPGATVPSLSYAYSSGGTYINLSLACGYFAALRLPPAEGGTQCTAPPEGEMVKPITLGRGTSLLAATTVELPGVLPAKADPSHGRDESLGVVLASSGAYQAASCTLPSSQLQLCLAGLGLFVDQTIAAQAGASALATIHDAVGRLSGPDAAKDKCPAALDVRAEHEINKKQDDPIPIPDESINTPPAVQAAVTVSFVPGEVTVCDTGLTPVLKTPGGFDSGVLSLNATFADKSIRGPFTYRADVTAWTSAPGAPSGQQLKTEFNPLSIEAAVDPRLSIVQEFGGSRSGAEPVLEIAHVTISAVRQEVTLVGPSGPLLRVALGPSLELGVGIKKKDAEQKVKDEESQGQDEASAEADVADEISGDAVNGLEEAASEFDGLDISGDVSKDLFDHLQETLLDAIETDPVLVVSVPAAVDAVPAEVTADDAAALDADVADTAVEVGGTEDLIDLFFVIPFL